MKINIRIWFLVLIMIGFIVSPYTITKLTTQGQEELDPEVLGEEYAQLEEEYLASKEEEEQILAEVFGVSSTEDSDVVQEESASQTDLDMVGSELEGEEVVEESEISRPTQGGLSQAPASAETMADKQDDIGVTEEEISAQPQDPETTSVVDQIIEKLNQDKNQEVEEPKEEAEPAFDPATAPSQVSLKVLLKENKKVPDFEVKVSFVGVGREPLDDEINSKGKIKTELETGRYYLKFEIENDDYKLEKDSPAFFLLPNKELDLGEIYLVR